MPHTVRSLARRLAGAFGFLIIACSIAAAQTTFLPEPRPAQPAAPEFLPHYDFHLEAARISSDDVRFKWDTHFGGNVDVVDYGTGRVNLLADYNAGLGSEYRAFDPNQGNYVLEASASVRPPRLELAGVFHHESRHLSDRPKRFSIDWNTVGARALGRVEHAGWRIDAVADVAHAIKHSYVDYTWTADADLVARHAITPHVGGFVHGTAGLDGVDPAIAGRSTQSGGRLEGGVRLIGDAGALELFGAIEKRIDAYPLDRVPQHWALFGFRLVNR